jgi:hypothetical protein
LKKGNLRLLLLLKRLPLLIRPVLFADLLGLFTSSPGYEGVEQLSIQDCSKKAVPLTYQFDNPFANCNQLHPIPQYFRIPDLNSVHSIHCASSQSAILQHRWHEPLQIVHFAHCPADGCTQALPFQCGSPQAHQPVHQPLTCLTQRAQRGLHRLLRINTPSALYNHTTT